MKKVSTAPLCGCGPSLAFSSALSRRLSMSSKMSSTVRRRTRIQMLELRTMG